MSTITTPTGQLVAYSDNGREGPPLVLLHALFMNRTMFEPQLEVFGDRYRVVTIDARGHGGSPTTEPFDFWDVARDVVAVLDNLGIGSAVIGGTSQGSVVSMRVALLRPDLVSALVLMGSSGDAEPPDVVDTLRQVAGAWRDVGPVDPVIEAITGSVLNDYPNAGRWQDLWRTLTADDVERNVNAVITRDALVARLPQIKAPALVLHGSCDNVFPVAQAEKLAAGLPRAGNPVIIDGGAHFLNLTDPQAVNDQLDEFLTALG